MSKSRKEKTSINATKKIKEKEINELHEWF